MSAERYRQALTLMNLGKNELQWHPKWVAGYAEFHAMTQAWEHDIGRLALDQALVIAYLRSLRDAGIAAWRRHQAAQALEIYQVTVLRNSIVDFRPIRSKLQEIAGIEKRRGGFASSAAACVCGEGNAGQLDASEPEPLGRMRARMRVLHHPLSTEQA